MILKLLRIEKGLKQEDIARIMGVSQQAISNLEKGSVNKINIENLYDISRALDIDDIELYKILRKYRK